MQRNLLRFLLVVLLFAASLSASAQSGQKVTVKGLVTSAEDKQPLIGVTVVTDTMQGVSTMLDGTYSIKADAGQTLSFSFIGYKSIDWKVPTDKSEVTFNVEMQPDTEMLEDVVVVAYGVRKKGTVAGSVSSVKAEKIETTPTAAFDQALQGQVPGLTVLSNTGEPSASAVMTIRGTNSINSGTAPLYILDDQAPGGGIHRRGGARSS